MSDVVESDMKLGLSRPLRDAVQQKFAQARQAGDLLFSDTELSVLRSRNKVPFQLRYCPALAKKPKDNVPSLDKTKPKPDPFDNPSKELLVDEIPQGRASHLLVLNKYPVIPNHFILATKANKPQTDLLEEDDLQTTYDCITSWQQRSEQQGSGRLFAFFNSGEHSGASQVHRHLQFLPIDDMKIGSEGKDDWQPLIDSMKSPAHPTLPLLHNPDLPFTHFATPLERPSPTSLYSKYIMLMKAAFSASRSSSGSHQDDALPSNDSQIEKDGQTTFSYNLALTIDAMAICPRKAEAASVSGLGEENSVSINGTILGGTLMVKELKEWNALQDNPQILDEILQTIAFPQPSTMDTKL